MVQDIQKMDDMINPWDMIDNIWYTRRRINEKTQVFNVFLDWDISTGSKSISNSTMVWFTNLTHEITWKKAFNALWWNGYYIPNWWTYIIKLAASVVWWTTVNTQIDVIKNSTIATYTIDDVVLSLSWTKGMWDWCVANLNKWDNLIIWIAVSSNTYPVTANITVNIIKLS